MAGYGWPHPASPSFGGGEIGSPGRCSAAIVLLGSLRDWMEIRIIAGKGLGMKYRMLMTIAGVAAILAGLSFGLWGPLMVEVYGVHSPAGEFAVAANMNFYRMRSFSFVVGMVLFGFGMVTYRARRIEDPDMQRSMMIGHFYAYVVIGFMSLFQEIAIWSNTAGALTVACFFTFAAGFGYLGYVVLLEDVPMRQPAFNGDSRGLRDRWKHEIGVAAAQQERNRLARDLHDSIKQQIFTINVSAAAAQARWDNDPSGAQSALTDVRNSSHEAMVEMEAMLQHLRPAPLETVGLVEALRKQCEALQYRTGAQVSTEFTNLPNNDRFAPGAQEAIYRIAQEALTNIARHARARNVKVRLSADGAGEWATLEVKDDGQGYDPATVREGMGMANIRSRCRESSSELQLQGEPGKGARVQVRMPLFMAPEKEAHRHFAIGTASMAGFLGILGIFQLFTSDVAWVRLLVAIPFALPFLMTALSRFDRGRRLAKSAQKRSAGPAPCSAL